MSNGSAQPLLRAEGVSKRFGITRALVDVSVSFLPGEVHALMGENGAGKSTLGKVICGLHAPDEGRVVIAETGGERTLRSGSLHDAADAGVRIVHQELAQCPNLTVAENLCLHKLPTRRFGTLDRPEMARRAERLLAELEPSIDVERPLGALSPGHRQIVQIATALDPGEAERTEDAVRAVVFDEPTSSLSIKEVDRLLGIVRSLAERGLTIIYVSHRMGEIFACCDRVTVLRDGRFVATSTVKDIDEPTLVEQMIGRRVETPDAKTPGGEAAALRTLADGTDGAESAGPPSAQEALTGPLLEVESMSSPGKLSDVSLAVRPGEILGLGGLVGSGRSELLDAIFGLDPRATGRVRVGGEEVRRGDPRPMIAAGVGYVPEDRKLQGLFFQLGMDENIVLPFMASLSGPLGIRRMHAEAELVERRINAFQIKTASASAPPDSLSGGNQQKLLIARWMGRDTRVLLLDEPTRGIDVGTKAEIYKLIRSAARDGAAVLLVSSEMPELLALADRVVVLADGRLTGELRDDEMTQSGVLTLATQEEPGRVGSAAG